MKKMVSNILLVLGIVVFIACGAYLLHYYLGAKQAESELDELLALKIESMEGEEETNDDETERTEEGKTIQKAYRKLYRKNRDLCGWITLEGTPIDYPVMQTKKESEYYLHRNYAKEYDANGLPFLDAVCDPADEESNLMIYGHHMKSGLMFAHLLDYDSADFYKKHPVVYFDTLYESRTYEVVAAFYSRIYKEEEKVFKYYNAAGHLTKKEYADYVKNIKKLSLYDTGVNPEYGEQLLTLVTCAYQTTDGRFVVVAKRKDS